MLISENKCEYGEASSYQCHARIHLKIESATVADPMDGSKRRDIGVMKSYWLVAVSSWNIETCIVTP